MATARTLYLASSNPGKVREFTTAAAESGVSVEPLPGIDGLPPCLEDGATFEANARKKAAHYSAYTGALVFADDSGLCVDALGSAPGVRSARYAGPHADDTANNRKLLTEMRGLTGPQRKAHYVCAIALAQRGRVLVTTQGRVDGLILESPRGAGGFGYDPLFLYLPLGKTFAELTADEKFGISHRGEAFRRLLDYLATPG
ncbi:MAG TPA: RdgB/HAM1 family non-canonical purine NTP pyrophosphatase [Terriglobia bacterium]|nr:RdgB/HAM1 family non-canonical purine NTP pyrophosphatase [Terriglobia bacterium]